MSFMAICILISPFSHPSSQTITSHPLLQPPQPPPAPSLQAGAWLPTSPSRAIHEAFHVVPPPIYQALHLGPILSLFSRFGQQATSATNKIRGPIMSLLHSNPSNPILHRAKATVSTNTNQGVPALRPATSPPTRPAHSAS